MSDDETVIDQISAALERDGRLPHPHEIAVSYRAGAVTLRGTVAGLKERRAALEIASSAPGVRVVEDELLIDPRDRWEDGEVRGAALQALMSSTAVPPDRVEVKVANGWLTLKGEVKHQYDSDAAFKAVSGLPGVGGITNEIRVVTAGVDG
jgi:osmotically-inducible protein OsmY